MEYYCGIDLGTSSVKVMLLGADGAVLGTEAAGYDMIKKTPCEAEQDMEYLWQQTKECIRALLGKHPGAATDVTDASSTGIFDVKRRQWAWELIDRLGLQREMFPVCGEAFERGGSVSASCSKETGIGEGTPLFLGGGDSMMQLVGNGIIKPGILSCNIGTASQVACALDKPVYDTGFRTNTFCHTGRGLWEIQGSSLTGGVALKWLRDNMLHKRDFEEMTSLAGTAPAGSNGLLFLPYLSGERCPCNDPNARGIYFGMSLYHSREHLIRSTMEGVIFGLKGSLEILKDMGIRFDRVIASGGGARGQLFREIQADVFEAEIHTAGEAEQACVGAAMTAAVGCGAFSSYEEACGVLTRPGTEVTVPDKERVKIYRECFARFQELYQRNKTLFS